ncbi:MAG: Dabb family protein [Odoribacter sp.]
MIRHIVLFKLKAFASDAEKQVVLTELKYKLEKLIHIIPELKKIEVGLNVHSIEKWDIALDVEVENKQDLNIYANHPAHQQIVKTMIAPIKEDRACVDFII